MTNKSILVTVVMTTAGGSSMRLQLPLGGSEFTVQMNYSRYSCVLLFIHNTSVHD